MSKCMDLFGVDDTTGVYIENLPQSQIFLRRVADLGVDVSWISEDDFFVFPIYVIESSQAQDYFEVAAFSTLSDMFKESKYILFEDWLAFMDSKIPSEVSGLEELL